MPRKNGVMKALLLVLLGRFFRWFVQKKAEAAHLEVERKFIISQEEAITLPVRLREMGFKPTGTVSMKDSFLPTVAKGEMMRIRDEKVSGRSRSLVTLKTWVQTADGGKERQESESEVGMLVRTALLVFGRMVVSSDLLSFSKERSLFEGKLSAREAVVSIDRVSGLGEFSGTYLEVEMLVPLGEDPAFAKTSIFVFIEDLFGKLREDVKRSYFDMLTVSRQK